MAGLLKRAADGHQDVAEVSVALKIAVGAREFCAVLSVKEAQTKVLYRTLVLRGDAP